MSTHDAFLVEIPALDERFYSMNPDELAFFLAETRIETESALKSHVLDIQAKAYKVYPYPCIRHFSFAKIKIARLPAYQRVLQLGKERENAILLDLGCCVGSDTRKIVADGFPAKGVITSDLHKTFWNLGHELFKSTPDTFPVPFVEGDIFDPSILEIAAPFNDQPMTPIPVLGSLTSLNPLRGHVSVIYTSSFFHLFNEERQLQLAQALAGLLSPEPKSVLFGMQISSSKKETRPSRNGRMMFCHSPESWKELWDGQVFEKGTVKVETHLHRITDRAIEMVAGTSEVVLFLVWSVTRL